MALLPLSLFTQLVEEVMEKYNINSFYLFHLYLFIDGVFMFLLYINVFKRSLTKNVALASFFIYFLVIFSYFLKNKNALGEKHFIDFTIECFLICFLVILLYIEMLKVNYKIELRYYTIFWLNGVHLIFYGGVIFVMGFYYYLNQTNHELAEKFMTINHFLNLFQYTGYTLIFLCTAVPRT